MSFKVATIFTLAAVLVPPVFAQEAEAPAENPELEAEIAYVEALVDNAYPDLAAPVIEETKKKWPESEVRFFAIEVRGLLLLGKFEEAEKKIAALPDRNSSKFWAARLEVANSYFSRGKKDECIKIYDEFFAAFPKPTKDLRKFFLNASYAYGQLLVADRKYEKAAERYSALLGLLEEGSENWCNIACETVEIYLRVADEKGADKAGGALKAATEVVDMLLWQIEQPLYFGRAVSMKAHIEQMKGDIGKSTEIIEEYKQQLIGIHDQILEADPEGSLGLLRQSPLPE